MFEKRKTARRELPYSPWSWIDRSEATLINSMRLGGCTANLYEVPERGTSGSYLLSVETLEETLMVVSSPPAINALREALDDLLPENDHERNTVLVDVFDSTGQAAYEAPAECVQQEPFAAWASNVVKQRISEYTGKAVSSTGGQAHRR